MFRLTLGKLLLFCMGAGLVCACTYHSRLSNSLYQGPDFPSKIPARVLIAADADVQKYFVFKDYHLSNSVHSYQIDLKQGALIAAADAVGALFETAEVDYSQHAQNYDWLVRLTYRVTDPRENSLESVQWLNYAQMPHIYTQLALVFENPHTGEIIYTAQAQRQNRVELSNTSAAALRVESSASAAPLLPVAAPVYTQQMGDRIRYTLTRDLRECLQEIMQTLGQERPVFTKTN